MKRIFLIGVLFFSNNFAGREIPDYGQKVYDYFVTEIQRFNCIFKNEEKIEYTPKDYAYYLKRIQLVICAFEQQCAMVHAVGERLYSGQDQVLEMFSDILSLEKECIEGLSRAYINRNEERVQNLADQLQLEPYFRMPELVEETDQEEDVYAEMSDEYEQDDNSGDDYVDDYNYESMNFGPLVAQAMDAWGLNR